MKYERQTKSPKLTHTKYEGMKYEYNTKSKWFWT